VTAQLWKTFLLPIGLLVTAFLALMGFTLAHIVSTSNAIEAENSRKSVVLAIDGQVNQMALLADDNALWDQAVRATYGTKDQDFFWESWGAPTLNSKNYHWMAVVDQRGKTIIAFADGRKIDADVAQEIGPSLASLSRAATERKQGFGSLVKTPGGPALVGIAHILPNDRKLESLVPAEGPHRIIFLKRLSNEAVTGIGDNALISDLRLAPSFAAPSLSGNTGIILYDAAQQPVGSLIWTPRTPGFAALLQSLPLFVGAALAHLILALLMIRHGISALKALNHQALIDSLSDLPNRRGLKLRLAARLKSGEPLSLAMMDLDGFKGVNDNYGHQVGDRLIKEVAAYLKLLIGPEIDIARLGGDEFALLVPGHDAEIQVESIAAEIIARFSQPFRIDERTVSVGISIGLASTRTDGLTAGELMRRADVAMYAAKRAGKMRINWYDDLLDQLQAKAHGVETELRAALDQKEFSLIYQPIFASDGTTIHAVEALLRWNSSKGEIAAADFIPVAEETGLIDRIGVWVLGQACRDGLQWPDVQVTINISPAQLRNPDFTRRLSEILIETGFPAYRLELEITERYLIVDPKTAQRVIDDVRALGVTIVLDDYGSGFASVGFLRKFAFGKMKIDRHLVKESETSEAARAVLQASVTVARALNMTVVAGGIETPSQADLMRVAGCNELQGWHLSEAVSADDISRKIATSLAQSAPIQRLRLA
jgi:diguanylate cyclase (GGDEF)-like protein